jgi:uncharacterized phage infection (PIP) family protein YhgE
MTANELIKNGASAPTGKNDFTDEWIESAIVMLRQQAQEIEKLKKVLKNIIDISDRKHDAWDEAKELLKKASEK